MVSKDLTFVALNTAALTTGASRSQPSLVQGMDQELMHDVGVGRVGLELGRGPEV